MTAHPGPGPGPDLPDERAASRVSAYVYGNLVVLGALASLGKHAVEDGTAAVVVAVTTATTLVAHVVAHLLGARVRRVPEGEHDRAHGRAHADELVRDAVPILSSGAAPAVLLATVLLGVAPLLAQGLAGLVVVSRLAGMGFVVRRLSGRGEVRWAWWTGVGLAVVGLVTAALKASLGH